MELMECLNCGIVFIHNSGLVLCQCCKNIDVAKNMLRTLRLISAEWHKGAYNPDWLLEHTKIDQVIKDAEATLSAAERQKNE